jgi:hypothetical protein
VVADSDQSEAYTKIGMGIITTSSETIDWETVDFGNKTVHRHVADLYNLTKAILEKTQGSELQAIAQSVFGYYEKVAAEWAAQALTETNASFEIVV